MLLSYDLYTLCFHFFSLNATLHTLMETFVTVSVQSEIAVRKKSALKDLQSSSFINFVTYLFSQGRRGYHHGHIVLLLKVSFRL